MSDPTSLAELITRRRSIKRFTDRQPTREEIERLLELVAQAPNHRMTQPWRFHVLGPAARRGYGAALGVRKAKRVADPDAAREVVEGVAARHEALPAMIAATWMGIQNLALAAEAAGLGTHIKTGAVMDDPSSRAAVGVPDGERIVAIVNLGEPAAVPDPKPRVPARDLTTWVD